MVPAACSYAAAAIIVAIAVLHIYWAFGGFWPGRDEESLARTVVGGPAGMKMPSAAACLAVTVVLSVAALLVLAEHHGLFAALPPGLVRAGQWGVVIVLALRGLYGFVDAKVRPSIAGTPYARLNIRVFSPLCLALAALAAFGFVG